MSKNALCELYIEDCIFVNLLHVGNFKHHWFQKQLIQQRCNFYISGDFRLEKVSLLFVHQNAL